MALAPVAYVLWQRFLRFDPENPIWPNRDRFVLSAGHASMLLYALLHLAGVRAVDPDYEVEGRLSITLDDIESFRQLDSKAAGHPEYRWASGVETTTGPLGQGVATSVGMAVASKWQAAHFNRPGFELFDFDTYVICGDGDLMEGVSHEAASFAGHQQLDNLCWIYDNNHISIDGRTEITLNDDVGERFEAYGWNVTRIPDANDFNEITPRPRRVQGHRGPPDADRRRQPHRLRLAAQAGHGRGPRRAARRRGGARDQALLRLARGRPVPGARRRAASASPRASAPAGRSCATSWEQLLVSYEREHESLERQIGAMQRRELPDGWDRDIPVVRRRTRRGSRPARPPTRFRTRSPRTCRGCSAARPTSPTRPRCASTRRSAAATSSPTTAPGASSTSGSASTSRRRSRTGSRSRSCGRRGRPT